ncbi:tyrosine-type recombinase/integrase [Oceanobacillus massiliensis]|uniref:tyrosine-type recombinase/integrase n=1 Tax=Oceanobacillus massiliensis TaxID=1465765 RepID=UPI000289FEAF|nr:site-specific integrase [Oceanobacillus massiliensis]
MIELVKEGSLRCTILLNNTEISLHWKKGFQLLKQYISALDEALSIQDIEIISRLPEKFGENTPRVLYKISEHSYFNDRFVNLFVKVGEKFLEEGTHFTKSAFCKFLSPYSKETNYLGVLLRDSSPFNDGMNQFNNVVKSVLTNALNKRSSKKIYKIYKTIKFEQFFKLATCELSKEFKAYLNHCMDLLAHEGRTVSFHALLITAIQVRIEFPWLNLQQQEFIINIIKAWRDANEKNNQQLSMEIGANNWTIPYIDVQTTRVINIDFSNLYKMKREVQHYLLYWYENGESPKALSRRYHTLCRVTNAIKTIGVKYTSFLDITYVESLQILDCLQLMKATNGRRKYNVSSISDAFSELRILFDWLKEKSNRSSLRNPFRRITFSNVDGFTKNSVYIPDEVVKQISAVIHDCPVHVQRTWLIMMHTGMRAGDVLKLKSDCLTFNEKEKLHYINFIPSKTFKQRRKSGLEDYHSVPLLSQEVVDIIQLQIMETELLRVTGKTPFIFVKLANSRRHDKDMSITGHQGTTIANSINRCIKRHSIKDVNGHYWHYTNHQCRKTLAVKLLTSGSSIADVGEILGHQNENTTRQYYQDVDALKIAELDRELFEKLFDDIDEEIRKAYTTTEFEQLKKEILTGSRETPEGHGSCLKHVSFGPCQKRSCVGCSLLLTGPQKLPMWRKLYVEQKAYLEAMIQIMKKQGIHNYEVYRDYQAENHLLSLYADTINKIESFIKERMPKYDEK